MQKKYIFFVIWLFLIVDIHPKIGKKYVVEFTFNIQNDFLLV